MFTLNNLSKKILIVIYIYFIIVNVELITLETETIKLDMNIYYYLKSTIFIYFLYIIYLFIQLTTDSIKKCNNIDIDNDDTTYVLLITSIIMDSLITFIYFIFCKKFVEDYKEDYLLNKLFLAYIVPKIIYSGIVTITILCIYIVSFIYIMDNCCFGKILFNSIDYCRGNRDRIFPNYNSNSNIV